MLQVGEEGLHEVTLLHRHDDHGGFDAGGRKRFEGVKGRPVARLAFVGAVVPGEGPGVGGGQGHGDEGRLVLSAECLVHGRGDGGGEFLHLGRGGGVVAGVRRGIGIAPHFREGGTVAVEQGAGEVEKRYVGQDTDGLWGDVRVFLQGD